MTLKVILAAFVSIQASAAELSTEEAAKILCDHGDTEAEEIIFTEENGEQSRFILSVRSERKGLESRCEVIIKNTTPAKKVNQ